jgi:RND superfamily putative drug exporter
MKGTAMFRRWGRFVYRRRRLVAGVAALVAVISMMFAGKAASALTTGGWYDPGAESRQVAARLATDFGDGESSLVVLFEAPGRTDAASAQFQGEVQAGLAALSADPRVSAVVGYAQTGSSRFIGTAGDSTWVLARLNISEDQATGAVDSLRSEIVPPAGMHVSLTGSAAVDAAMSAQSEQDLGRAESISLPVALLILVLVFGTLVAAGLPLLIAGLAIPTTMTAVWLLAQHITMSIFVTSVVTMLGLALAIDYSLFMVSRFREELARGRTVEEAVERTVATSGKAVAFSGSAVALGLSGLLFFSAPTLSSMGIGGALIALVSVAYALTFLPAVLGMLGPNVERLSVPLPRRSKRVGGEAGSAQSDRGFWERIASAVMRRPVAVLVPVLAMLLAFGLPFLGEKQGIPGANALPAAAESRIAWEKIQAQFPAGETAPIDLLVTVSGDPTSAQNAATIARFAAGLRGLAGVASVNGPFALTDSSGLALPAADVAALLTQPAERRPAALNALLAADIRGSTVHLQIVTPLAGTPAGQELVATIRGLSPSSGLRVQVGGSDAAILDFLRAQDAQLPVAVAFILVAMAAMLMLQFGSVVLSFKAVVMTLLSLTASFGALVWVFQDGNLSGPLAFSPLGFTVAINPILMFSVVFGLSMDYEVLLLSRIQEAYRRTGDNTSAVAEGLSRTGRVITGAALIMVGVFAAFGLADGIVIKSLGVGMALAVLIDATVIRALLVPATMRILGRWNWWSPAPMARVTARLGFGEVEDEAHGSRPRDDRPTRPGRKPLAGSAAG